MRRESWSVESTIGLLFTIIIAILALAIVSAIGLAAYAAPPQPKRPEFLEPRYAPPKPAGISDNRQES